MIYNKIFRFFYAMFWLLFGASIAFANGFDGSYIGLGAFIGLFFGHGLMATIVVIVERITDYSGLGK